MHGGPHAGTSLTDEVYYSDYGRNSNIQAIKLSTNMIRPVVSFAGSANIHGICLVGTDLYIVGTLTCTSPLYVARFYVCQQAHFTWPNFYVCHQAYFRGQILRLHNTSELT